MMYVKHKLEIDLSGQAVMPRVDMVAVDVNDPVDEIVNTVLDNILCILFAYATNRAFVFRSRTQGREMAKEFGAFVTCRLGTLVLDAVIMMVGGNLLAAQGTALMESLLGSFYTVMVVGTGAAASSAASVGIIGGADGPTAIFVSSYSAQTLWGLCVKVFSNVIVVVLNYVFSKLIIFKKKK